MAYQYMSTTPRQITLKATSTWDRDTAPTTKKKQDNEIKRRITGEWTAFAKHREIFKGNIETCFKKKCTIQAYFQLYTARNVDSHHSCKEQASSRTNKDAKEYVKHHIPEQKNKHLRKKNYKSHKCD